MSIVVIGVNHKTAPVAIREQVAFSDQQVDDTLRVTSPLFTERVILSTCNRTEVYATVPENVSQNDLTDWYIKQHPSANNHLQPHIYQLSGFDAIQHTFRVACGLDSMVLGEPQILGQLKQALRQAVRVKPSSWLANIYSARASLTSLLPIAARKMPESWRCSLTLRSLASQKLASICTMRIL